jgi:secreted PhoX family phosphatase
MKSVRVPRELRRIEMSKVENKIASAISRREFLSVTAAASGAALLASCAPAATAAPTAAPTVAAVEPTKAVSDETYVWLGAVTAIAF